MTSLQLGDIAPDFDATTADGALSFHTWLGDSWGILFSHPADFTPVCTTELGRAAALEPEFARRGVKIAALSVDSAADHRAWSADIAEVSGSEVSFPMIADPDRKVADLYGMIPPGADNTATVRSVFVIGPDKRIKLTMTYPASTGRNFDEILRVVDSLQLTARHQVATPVDWRQGEDVVITPAVSDEEAQGRFPGYRAVKPYLRMTPQPKDAVDG
ncbi:peroxiredoxin [Streptomyces sp. NPDC013178]|uniref:peroxiredoxin n=1 Tax=Streptomyces sp. NPDC013178 TaxID=3155118 RepID=UPI0033DBED36